MESSGLPPEFWQAQTRYRIEQLRRGEPTDGLSSLVLPAIKGVFLVLTLPTRLAESRKLKPRSNGGGSQTSSGDPILGTDAARMTHSTWKIRDV